MQKGNCIVLFLSVVLSSCSGYRPLSLYEESLRRSLAPDFSFFVFSYLSDDAPRSDFFLAISNKALQFTREGERYVASYHVSVRVTPSKSTRTSDLIEDSESTLIEEKSWTETITENAYEATTGMAFHVSPRSFLLGAGTYSFIAEVTDEFSKKMVRRGQVVEIPNFPRLFLGVSSIIVGSRIVDWNGKEALIPNLLPEMSTVGDQCYASFEVYDKFPGRDIRLDTKLFLTHRYDIPMFLSPYHRGDLAKPLGDSLFWAYESTLTSNASTIPIRLSLPNLEVGHYRLELTLHSEGGVATVDQREIRSQQAFSIWPFGFPEVPMLDQQIEVVEYLASPEELGTLKQATTKEEKQRWLGEFWSKRWNREEYYQRVDYANRFFSCVREGWRTPFGWTYIVVGPPDEIHITPQGGEQWRYNLSSNRTLLVSFMIRELEAGNVKCKEGGVIMDPSLRRELVLRWRRPG